MYVVCKERFWGEGSRKCSFFVTILVMVLFIKCSLAISNLLFKTVPLW